VKGPVAVQMGLGAASQVVQDVDVLPAAGRHHRLDPLLEPGPASLPAPPLSLRSISPCRSVLSASLYVGLTTTTRTGAQRGVSPASNSWHVSDDGGLEAFVLSRSSRSVIRRSRRSTVTRMATWSTGDAVSQGSSGMGGDWVMQLL
jgi:hypothetical protein